MYSQDELLKRRARLSAEQLALLQKRLRHGPEPVTATIPRHPADSSSPLSFAQERFWLLQQLQPENTAYNEPIALSLHGPLNYNALWLALKALVQRHEILRTTFPVMESGVRQLIHPLSETATHLPLIDLRSLAASDRLNEVKLWTNEEMQRPFSLLDDLPWRSCLLCLDDEEHIFLVTMHHIITDAWSLELFVRELMLLYRSYCDGQPSPLPDLSIQYADYACWQRQWAESETVRRQVTYWQHQLKGPLPVLTLPADHPRPAQRTYRGQRLAWSIPTSLYQQLRQFSRQEGATLFMLLLTTLNILFYRYTQQEDIVIGTPVAGRLLPELEPLLGSFVNTVLLRTDLSGNPRVRELLQRVRAVALEAYDHQEVPFEKLVELLKPERHTDHNAFFQVMFVLQNVPQTINDLSMLAVEPVEVDIKTSRNDISLVLQESARGLSGYVEYSADLFEASTIERMLAHYQRLLEGIVAYPEAHIAELPLLSPAEERQMLVEWNATQPAGKAAGCIHQVIEAQAACTPDAAAVVCEGQQLTYRTLNERANQLAHYLRRLGVGPEVRVGLCLDRSLEMMVGICAILKAGGAYVPLDPAYPPERLSFVIQDTQMPVLLTMQSMLTLLPESPVRVICLDSEWEQITREPVEPLANAVKSDNLAYVIYTSGSTGQPKGVMVSHRNLLSSTLARMRYYREAVDRFLLLPSFAFDSSVAIIFWTFCQGGTLILPRTEHYPDIAYLAQLIAHNSVSHMLCTPSLYKPFLEQPYCQQLLSLSVVVAGGEVCPKELVERHYELLPQARLFNEYGPTEGTVWCSVHECQPHGSYPTVPIGAPISGTRLYVLDRWLQPVPVGVAGELHIGGAGVSRGYLNQPELTARQYVPDPFSEEVEARLYKTGDRVRYLPGGEIEFLGRVDNQIKIRGYRIEPEEIKTVLERHPAVRDVAVVAREDIPGNSRLVAYVVLREEPSATARDLHSYLKQHLPSYMLPSSLVLMDCLPLNPNGKVGALPAPEAEHSTRSFTAARDPIEEVLSALWSQVLHTDQIDVFDDFFRLGGHSLLATQLAARIRTMFGLELPLQTFFSRATIAEQAEALKEAMRSQQGLEMPPLAAISREQDIPLSFTQQRQWFLHQLDPDSSLYTLSGGVRLSGPLQIGALEQSLQEVVRRHEILRTTFAMKGERLVQLISPTGTLPLNVVDLREQPASTQEAEIMRLAAREQRRSFDLSHGPLLYATLLRLAEDEHVFFLTGHHSIFDGWSVEILLRELAVCYTAFHAGTPLHLPELPVQYADFAFWQRSLLEGERLERLLAYWKLRLAHLPMLTMPADHPHPSERTFHAATVPIRLSAEQTAALKNLSRGEGVTVFMILLAAFQAALARYSGQDDIVVGSPIAGRNRTELEHLIGCFINTLVLRTDVSGNPTFAELLRRVRDTSLGAYAHQDLPFERLIEALQPERDLRRNPLFQVFFAFQNIPEQRVNLPALSAAFLEQKSEQTLFDLDLTLWEDSGGISGAFKYNTALFEPETITRLHGYFLTLLAAMAADPAQRIGDIPLLSEEEKLRLLAAWNATRTAYPVQKRFHEYVAQQARSTPDAIAVSDDVEQVSYRELDRRADRLAAHLARYGVKPERPVGVYTERSVQWAVAVLAIFKVGGVYLPLDPRHPQARLRSILAHSACHLILTTQELESSVIGLLQTDEMPILGLETLSQDEPQEDWQPISYPAAQLAYVIYTSGSTGKPKGVMVEHRGMLNHLYAKIDALKLAAGDIVAQTASQCFDISLWQLLAAWLVGGQARIYNDDVAMNPERLAQGLAEDSISIVEVVPSLLQGMIAVQEMRGEKKVMLDRLRWMIPTGEALSAELCERWLHLYPSIPLLNAYGPTECSDDVTHYVISEPTGVDAVGQMAPIGKPVGNLRVYVLDRQQQLQPVGVRGEIFIGGAGVGRGYLHDPARTAEQFLPDPWSETGGERLYRTGDTGRYRADGTLEFLGRIDQQVKIRGYRIELGEVEQVLRAQAGVKEAAVVVREGAAQRLVGYVVAQEGSQLSMEGLRKALSQLLPEYMVPPVIVQLHNMPLTPNGKLDRRALSDPAEQQAGKDYVAPRTPLEAQLAALWADVLKLPRVGLYENFFEVGGHSLLTVPLLARVQETWQVTLPLRSIFEFPTVDQLAAAIEKLLIASQDDAQTEPEAQGMAWYEDAVLDPTIVPQAEGYRLLATEPAAIFLTNSTGFLGTFLLADLLQNTSAQIYCLVRCQNDDDSMRRIKNALEAVYLWRPAFAGRIISVRGDLAQPRLGVASAVYEHLAATIDTIYHTAALVSQVLPYEELRAVNVLGTQEVLRLAASGKVKSLHHISTLGVLSAGDDAGCLLEQESLDSHRDSMLTGYNQSKWVAEKLVTLARERGLPVAIYRPGRLTGHSQTGAWQTQDLLCRQIKGCIQLGSIPSAILDETLSITPVDYASQAIVALSLQETSVGQVFHLCNPRNIVVDDLVDWINSFGYSLKKVPYAYWRAELQRAVEQSTDNALAPFLTIYPEQVQADQPRAATARVMFDDQHTRAGLAGTSITCPPADARLFHTYLSYFVRCGFLPAPPTGRA